MSDTELHERWWNWIFTTSDGSAHPLKGNHDKKQVGGVYLLAGSLPNAAEHERKRTIDLPAGSTIFVPVDNVLCTETEGDPKPLTGCAKDDIDKADIKTLSVTLDGKPKDVQRLGAHGFKLTPTKKINGTKVPEGKETQAAADGYYSKFQLPEDKGQTHTLVIKGRTGEVTYTVRT